MRLVKFGCTNCGSPHLRERNEKLYCISCGSVFERESESSEKRDARNLYLNRLDSAEKLLRLQHPRFDDAEDHYRDFIKHYPNNSDGYWGLVRAKYGIKYEDDITGRKIPTCYKSSYEDFTSDPDFKKAIHLAESEGLRERYIREADIIASVYREWQREAQKYDYDVFISFKDEDAYEGIDASDRKTMEELYNRLTRQGYKVFFSPISLSKIIGKHFDAYIFNALQKAKVMIVYGSRAEYFESEWVRNEWARYLRMISDGKKLKNSCIVAYEGFNPKALPRELRVIQGIDASNKNAFYQQVISVVKSIIDDSKAGKSKINFTFASENNVNSEFEFEIADGKLKRYKGKNKSVIIPSGVKCISGEAFYNRADISFVSIPEGVISIEKGAFSNCSSLAEIVVPATVAHIGEYAFYKCKMLKSITLSGDIKVIKDSAFRECDSLISVSLPSGLESIENNAFCGCKKLKSVYIPSGMNQIGDYAFMGCRNLEKITIPSSVSLLGSGVFDQCRKLKIHIDSPDSVYYWENGWNCKRPIYSYLGRMEEVTTKPYIDSSWVFYPVMIKRIMMYGYEYDVNAIMLKLNSIFKKIGGPMEESFDIEGNSNRSPTSDIKIYTDGISCFVGFNRMLVGSEEYMRRCGIDLTENQTVKKESTVAVMYVAIDGKLCTKLYLRYAFSEEFTSLLPDFKKKKIVPIINTSDPNITNELLSELTCGSDYAPKVKKRLQLE